jgi:polysaccharide pyruvyl transferase CsaB
MTKKICISGYYGFDNFGDETILKVLIDNLKQLNGAYDITVFSSNPEKTAKEHNVKSVRTFNIKEIIKALKETDCLISGGGSLLQDVTSAKSLLYYLFVIGMAQSFKKKTIIFAQGIGPVNNLFLRFLTIRILKKADYITVRDNNSLDLLNKYKINAQKCSDPVWNINAEKTQNTGKTGIQLRSFVGTDDTFLYKLGENINKYYSNKEINILSLQNKIDLEICNKFKDILLKINPEIKTVVVENTSNSKVINDITQCDELIAMRYHACLIAIKTGVKLLPLSYDIKVETLAKEFGLSYLDLKNKTDIDSVFSDFYNKNISYNDEKIQNLKYNFKTLEEHI